MEGNNNFNNEQKSGLNTPAIENSNVRVINTNGVNSSVANTTPVNNLNNVNTTPVQQTNPINNNVPNEPVTAIAGTVPQEEKKEKKKKGIQEIIMYVLMIIVIILIILLLLKFCSENSGKSIYQPSNTQNKTTTTTRKQVITDTTTTNTTESIITEPTTEITRPTVTVNIPGNPTKKTRTTTTVRTPVNPITPVNPTNPTKSTTTTTTTRAAVYTYTFSKPTSETFAVNIFKDGQVLSGSVYIWGMDDELLSLGVVGPNKVVTITTAFADLSTHPKLKFSFQSDPEKKYTMTYHS